MEPNKFETKISEKFNARNMAPSANAWDRLDAMLTLAEIEKKPKKNYWLGIAASFFILFGAGWFYVNSCKTETQLNLPNNNPTTTYVDSTKNTENNENKKPDATQNTHTPQKLLSPAEKMQQKILNPIKKAKTSGLAIQIPNENTPNKPLENMESQNKPYQIPSLVPETKNAAQTKNTLASNIQIEPYKYKRKPTTINPNDLLENADKELSQQTFKEKAWAKIKKVGEAFAERNQE